MSNRKSVAPKSASVSSKRGSGKKVEAKLPPQRKRFVISSKASKPLEPAPKAKKTETPAPATTGAKMPANGHTPIAPATTALSTVDLTETIKTLLHLGQEHGYVTYDDINDASTRSSPPKPRKRKIPALRSWMTRFACT
jgi:hypothetical protein